MNITLWLILLLLTKHFVVDFPLQLKYQLNNKGTYGHPGGILHSGLHGLGTYVCIVWYAPIAAIVLAFVDMIVHYHIDWIKVNVNKKFNWGPTHDEFWWLFGLDQFLHALTYISIVALIVE